MDSSPTKHDELVDRFVEVLNARGVESLPDEEVPEELRISGNKNSAGCAWRIRAAKLNPWVAELDKKLAEPFPVLYHSLIARYRFAEFEIGPVLFFANTGHGVFHELANCIFRDQYVSPVLLDQGLLQFAQPDSVNYDPICFDTRRSQNGDAPVVRIDHEDILSRNNRGRIVEEISPSFQAFIQRAIAGDFNAQR